MSKKLNRELKYFKQLKLTLIFKIFAMVASFMIIPLLIKSLGVEVYGVWATILSIIMWIVYFDLGLGNGLRNKVGIALVDNKIKLAKKSV